MGKWGNEWEETGRDEHTEQREREFTNTDLKSFYISFHFIGDEKESDFVFVGLMNPVEQLPLCSIYLWDNQCSPSYFMLY